MSIRAIRSDTEHLPCVIEVIGADIYNLALTGDKACSLTREGWTSTGTCPKVLILDHHPNDSRTDIAEDQQAVQTLTSRMGTGGGNVPLILEPITYDAQVTNPLRVMGQDQAISVADIVMGARCIL